MVEPKQRRNRMDIIVNILTTAMEGELKTHIMYRANLSYKLLKKYLALLLETNLLQTRKEGARVIYTTTKNGIELLEKIKKDPQTQQKSNIRKAPGLVYYKTNRRTRPAWILKDLEASTRARA